MPWHAAGWAAPFARVKAFDAERLPWATMRKAIGPALEATVADATAGAIAAALARGLQFDPEVIAAVIAEMLPGYVTAWEAEVIATSQARIAAAVAQYEAGAISLAELTARVDLVFDPARASMIATTETTRLYDVVGKVINEQAGVEKVRFLTVRDQWVCPLCETFDNKVYVLKDAPELPIHVNCRCFTAAEVPEARSRPSVSHTDEIAA